ncbi:MAG: DUF4298 domain-containing protein [Clostridia bacterium]|nr:DUF4298 domain-containing protein [Clostridia bacterium]
MKRTDRIARYEKMLEKAALAARQMEEALDAYEGIQKDLRALEKYYTSDTWKKDYAADEKGLLPADLRRGVLSQDGIDHLLGRFAAIRRRMEAKPDET